MKVVISNIKSISQKDVRKIQSFCNSINGKKVDLNLINGEYPNTHLVKEICFETDYEVEDILHLMIDFLFFIQGKKKVLLKGEWFSLKIENFLLSFFNENGGNLKIDLK